MRLTLRTLLAYLDDILDPVDKEQLAKKIESSEFAEDLVHRTRDTARRLRLSAPQVIGSGMGLDPNTVAEYLDNVLPPESVGDFERICLESDMHLAEAAACHHVLTMVLGEPADVDPKARQRMYSIASECEERKRLRVEGPHIPLGTVAVAAAPAQATSVSVVAPPAATEIDGVPEYLRTSPWSGYRGALLGLAALLFVGAAFFVVSGMRGWFGGEAPLTGLTADAASGLATPDTAGQLEQLAAGADDQAADETAMAATQRTTEPADAAPVNDPYAPVVAATPLDASPPQPLTPPMTSNAAPVSTGAGSLDSAQQGAGPDAVATEPALPGGNAAPPSRSDSQPLGDPTAVASLPAVPATGAGTDSVAADSGTQVAAPVAGDATAVDADTAGSNEASDIGPDVPEGPAELGTYLGRQTVLLRYDAAEGRWYRVEPRSAVVAGEQLLALPEFRPGITLTSGLHMDISGGTQASMRTANEVAGDSFPEGTADVPAVEVVYGRIILINTSGGETRVRLVLGSSVGEARLARNATLAVEVERQHVPGNDPRKSPAPVVARLYAPDGGVDWQDASGSKAINNASRWTVSDGISSDVLADASPPEWIDKEPEGQPSEHRLAAPKIENALVSDRPADLQLLELFEGNIQREMKSLAAKSCMHVGIFEPFVDALRDSQQESNWPTHIKTLRVAMALSPDSATNVWNTLVKQRDRQAAADLYEMLCGYNEEQIGRTPDEIKSGLLLRLIDWLEKDSLDYRVLAVHNLWEITGKRLMPDPSANAKERAQNVRNWRRRLEQDDLRSVRRR